MLQVQRALLRPRLRRSWLVKPFAIAVVVVGFVIGMTAREEPHAKRAQFVDRLARLEEEVRRVSLEACEARVERDRIASDKRCAAGEGSKKDCDRAEGQCRMDPCSHYQPRGLVRGTCSRTR